MIVCDWLGMYVCMVVLLLVVNVGLNVILIFVYGVDGVVLMVMIMSVLLVILVFWFVYWVVGWVDMVGVFVGLVLVCVVMVVVVLVLLLLWLVEVVVGLFVYGVVFVVFEWMVWCDDVFVLFSVLFGFRF